MQFLDTLFELFLYLFLDDTLGKKLAKKPWHHTFLQVLTVVLVCAVFALMGAGIGVLASGANLALGLGLAISGAALIIIYLLVCVLFTKKKLHKTATEQASKEINEQAPKA
jgi:heme A synthase